MKRIRNFYRELRRREVLGTVALYVVAAWAVIEVGDMAIDSGWITGITTHDLFTLALVGLPIVLVAGWRYNLTRRGVYRTTSANADGSSDRSLRGRDYLLLLVFVAVWAGAFVYLRLPPIIDKSIAILPFENRGNDPDNATLAFGLHDDLLTQMQRIGQIKLIAQNSVRQVDQEAPDELTAQKLGVAYLMKGTVERVLDHIRVNVVLIEAANAKQIWAASFDRELTAENLFGIRDDITRAITRDLRTVLTPEQQPRIFDLPTQSLEASLHYARGRQLMVNRNSEELKQALEEFQEAVAIDPDYALAWVGIADLMPLMQVSGGDFFELGERGDQAALKAVDLNPNLAEAQVAYGDFLMSHGKREEAMSAFERAIELAPNYALAYHRYAGTFRGPDDVEKKLTLWQRATQLDPITPVYRLNLAGALMGLGREEEAVQQAERLIESNPDFALGFSERGKWANFYGRFAEAVGWQCKALRVDPNHGDVLRNLAGSYLALEDYDAANKVMQWMEERLSPNSSALWFLHLELMQRKGDWPGAIVLLQDAMKVLGEGIYLLNQIGSVYYQMGEFQQAGASWSHQADIEQTIERWRDGEDDDCRLPHVLIATGEEALGRKYLDQMLTHIDAELSAGTRHPYLNQTGGVCFLLDGNPDKAFDYYTGRIDHGHIADWWYIKTFPIWDSWRDDSRFIALDQKAAEMIAKQRELLAQMVADGEPTGASVANQESK